MVRDRGKKVKGDDENSEQTDGELVLSIVKPKEIQDELEEINEEARHKVLETDQKPKETGKPAYDRSNEIIQSIPDFWQTAFLSHPMLGELLTDEDRKIFEYLDSLDVEDSKDVKSGYSITFNFRPNPFFEDSKLTKTFTFLGEEGTRITATSIKWKEGMGLPYGAAREKRGNEGPLSGESFFPWFSDAQHKDVTAEIHDKIADIIMEDLWAYSLTLFNNDADEAYEYTHAVPTKNRKFPRKLLSFSFVAPREGLPLWGTPLFNQVSEEETADSYVYKMDRPWLRPDEVRVEIRRGHALWVIGQGDEPVKVELPRNNKMRISGATASMSADGVLTVMIPKRHGPWKWDEFKDWVSTWFKTVLVGVSS